MSAFRPEQLDELERKFVVKRQIAAAREEELFRIFDGPLSSEEERALKFLYAYMPLNDLADYDGELFLRHVRHTLAARQKVPWGSRIPEPLFYYFVLPYRVNNENVEDCRGVLFDELIGRVKDLSMEKAILETNHWCHEKATYIGNDVRTVSPLTLIRTAKGRCGEQSTLAVAALRSIGIPARQCYTPRWAHCDSNHAWVEAWADGQWYFFGACEPEPRLNQGWFDAPARRAMLVNTRVPANYSGPETITLAHEWYTEINVLDTYAPCRTIKVQAFDEAGKPATGAKVSFQVYNAAELTPIATLPVDEKGEVVLRTGYGDLWLHATDGSHWAQRKLAAADNEDQLVLNLIRQPQGVRDLVMTPPPEGRGPAQPAITEEEQRRHDARVREGAQIRTQYEATFLNEEEARKLAEAGGLPADRVWEVIRKAKGNSCEIAAFLQEQSGSYGSWPLRLLESLNDKDLTDTFRPTLEDHLSSTLFDPKVCDEETYVRYVQCPRVLFEMIGPYKHRLNEAFTLQEKEVFRSDPSAWARELNASFDVLEDMTYYQGSATPLGSFSLKKGDRLARDILFVAGCRSLGIPARLHPSQRHPQYQQQGRWMNVQFEPSAVRATTAGEAKEGASASTGYVQLVVEPAAKAHVGYFENVSIARLRPGGTYQTLQFPYGDRDLFLRELELTAGDYRITTGTRLQDGTTLVRLTGFRLEVGERLTLPLTFMKEAAEGLPDLGHADPAVTWLDPQTGKPVSLGELAVEQGVLLAWIEPGREPTQHLLRELGELKQQLNDTGAALLLAVGDAKWTPAFDPHAYTALPDRTRFVRDAAYAALSKMTESSGAADKASFPLVHVVDGRCRIRYRSFGYKLGVGREAWEALTMLPGKEQETSAQKEGEFK